MQVKVKPYEETHMEGNISIENIPSMDNFLPISIKGDLGIQIAKDGRVWVCIDGIAFLRFTPNSKYFTVGGKLNPNT